MNHLFSVDTPAGILMITDDGTGIVSVRFDGEMIISPETALQKETDQQLRQYFEGSRKKFDLPVHPDGTVFRKKVWKVLETIPYGKTMSYQDVAEAVGNPKACRAVGMAIHDNPVPVIIPCHRVINKDGSAGGYAGGMERKKLLLKLEKEYA